MKVEMPSGLEQGCGLGPVWTVRRMSDRECEPVEGHPGWTACAEELDLILLPDIVGVHEPGTWGLTSTHLWAGTWSLVLSDGVEIAEELIIQASLEECLIMASQVAREAAIVRDEAAAD